MHGTVSAAKCFDVLGQQRGRTIRQGDGEEVGSAGLIATAIAGHGRILPQVRVGTLRFAHPTTGATGEGPLLAQSGLLPYRCEHTTDVRSSRSRQQARLTFHRYLPEKNNLRAFSATNLARVASSRNCRLPISVMQRSKVNTG